MVRNYRCKGGEIDLVMRAADGTLAFVEVQQRSGRAFGGAAASVTPASSAACCGRPNTTLARWTTRRRAVSTSSRWSRGASAWLPNAFDQNAASDDGASWAAS